jgi:hypothetical protein
MPSEPPLSQTYILRVWLEPGADGGAGEWRGELKQVPGGATKYFRTWDALPALLRQVVEGE